MKRITLWASVLFMATSLLMLCVSVAQAADDPPNYMGTYFYNYEYNSTDSFEDHYIVLEHVNGRIVGRYYGTSDDFDEGREGYGPGFYVAEMKNLQIKGNEITFEISLSEDDMFSKAVDLKYKSSKQIPAKENPLWENKQLITSAVSEGKNPGKYKGNITNGRITLEVQNVQRIFDNLAVPRKQAAGHLANDKYLAAMKAYKSVLRNEEMFYNTNNTEYYKLNEFNYWSPTENHPLTVSSFTVIDMDDDGIPEVILELTTGFDGSYEVLHYENDKVYGFNFVYRGMLNLSNDGTYLGSSGAFDGCILKAAYIKYNYKEEMVAHSESRQDTKGNITVFHYIGKSKVTEEAYDTFLKKVFDNPAVWHDFTDANIDLVFK